jgi:hypothetical protein
MQHRIQPDRPKLLPFFGVAIVILLVFAWTYLRS